MRFHKILCPVDFSPESHETLLAAVDMARDADAPLEIIYVADVSALHVMTGFQLVPEVIPPLTDPIDLAGWKAEAERLGAKQVTTRLLAGSPWEEIVKAARDDRVDLIVIGTHGRTGFKHVFLGSVAEQTVRHAPCPVLVVRNQSARA